MANNTVNNKAKLKIGAIVAAFIIFVIFVVVFFSRYAKTVSQQKEINSLEQTASSIREENSRVEKTLENSDDDAFLEKAAREDDYVKPEERIYYDSVQ